MADRPLSDFLADERAGAIRALLGSPLLDAQTAPDAFRSVTRHADWLIAWFETACGWNLVVDPAAGFARLAKRSPEPDVTRPLIRVRGSGQPFDRRRYELLCLACAELVRHPVTTIGLLARAVAAASGLETGRHSERVAFIDALRALIDWGALRASAGDVDAFVESDRGNAILVADTARLHRLLSAATSPSSLAEGSDCASATEALLKEPRYGDAGRDPDAAEEEQRLRWVRHRLGRRLLDDPVTYFDDISPPERDYITNPAGRRWIRERVAEAGLELEERVEGILAVDPDAVSTDRRFPAPHGNAHQCALLLVEPLRSGPLRPDQLRDEVGAILARFPGWARSHREADGPARLAAEAVDLLAGFGLVHQEPDGTLVARPALARYQAGAPERSPAADFLEEYE